MNTYQYIILLNADFVGCFVSSIEIKEYKVTLFIYL